MKNNIIKAKSNENINKIFTEPEARGQYSTSMVVKSLYWWGENPSRRWASLSVSKSTRKSYIKYESYPCVCVMSKYVLCPVKIPFCMINVCLWNVYGMAMFLNQFYKITKFDNMALNRRIKKFLQFYFNFISVTFWTFEPRLRNIKYCLK